MLTIEIRIAQGGGHFLQGEAQGPQFLVAGFHEGLLAYPLDRGSVSPVRLAPHALCARFFVDPQRVVCTGHEDSLTWLDYADAGPKVLASVEIAAPPSGAAGGGRTALEGLTIDGDRLYVAAHRRGLLAFSVAPPHNPVPFDASDSLSDAWDVVPLGGGRLAVADGAAGLVVIEVGDGTAPVSRLARLALPGTSAFLRVADGVAYVAALGGGGHAVDVHDPGAPRWLGTIAAGMVFDVRPVGPYIVAAAGHDLVVARRTDDRIETLATHRSRSFAMSVASAPGGKLYAAEFQDIARYAFGPPPTPGPLPAVAPTLGVAEAAGPVATSFLVRNVGDEPLHVRGLGAGTSAGLTLPGAPLDVPPGGARLIDLSMAARPRGARVVLDTDGGPSGFDIHRSRQPQAGDRLPAGLAFRGAVGAMVDVDATFMGKVSVLLIAAASCPLAYYALHSITTDLADLLASPEVAALSINPWDGDPAFASPPAMPHLLAPLTSAGDHDHDHGGVLGALGQEAYYGPPMPALYVLGRDGVIRYACWGYDPAAARLAVEAALAEGGGPAGP